MNNLSRQLEKISAVIPMYNSEKYIEETLESLLNQKVPLDEIILIDDCSKDNTCRVVSNIIFSRKNKFTKVKLINLDKNVGPSESRNIGLTIAKNNLVLFMDHDDIAEPCLVEEEYKRFLELKYSGWNVKLIYSSYKQIDFMSNEILGIHEGVQFSESEALGYEFVRNYILSTSGILIDKKAVIDVGGFDKTLRYSQDWDLWLKLAQIGSFGYVDKPLVRIRRYSGNTSSNLSGFLNDEKIILQKYNLKFIENAIQCRKLPTYKNNIDFVSILFRLEKYKEAYEILLNSVKLYSEESSAYFFLGLCFIKEKKYVDAEMFFKESLERNHNNAATLNNLACTYLTLGKKDEAQELLKKAVLLLPNYNDAKYNLRLLNSESNIKLDDLKYTWRELRKVLLNYSN